MSVDYSKLKCKCFTANNILFITIISIIFYGHTGSVELRLIQAVEGIFCKYEYSCYVCHRILSKRRVGRMLFHFCSAFKIVFFFIHKLRKPAHFTMKKCSWKGSRRITEFSQF